jgi:signal transduction histidine kinase
VCRLTRSRAGTLRNWEERYRLLTPGRTEGGTRLYSPADVRRIQEIQRLLKANGHSLLAVSRSLAGERQGGEDQLNQLKATFLSTMRHELRTPLNAILGFSDLLHSRAAGDLTPKQERYVKNIQQGGRRLLRLVDDILEYAVVQSHEALERETVALKPLLDELAATYRAEAELRSITFTVQADSLPTVRGDRLRLGRAFRQLMDNAVKFTGDGGKVMVTATQAGNAVVIAVRDTGLGIALDDQQRIFEPFVQVDGSDSRPHDGSGLGLAIAHRIVALHGGSITVQSAREQGSTFTVRLPIPGQAPAPARRKDRSEMRAA